MQHARKTTPESPVRWCSFATVISRGYKDVDVAGRFVASSACGSSGPGSALSFCHGGTGKTLVALIPLSYTGMSFTRHKVTGPMVLRTLLLIGLLASLSACGNSGPFGTPDADAYELNQRRAQQQLEANGILQPQRESIFDLFQNKDDPNTTVEVNKYLWSAAQDVLNFLPIESVDPFSGVIVMGYGTPPGSNRAYRATVYVRDPALDARSLNVAIRTRSGPASRETTRAVEDAILTRARQLRIADSNL